MVSPTKSSSIHQRIRLAIVAVDITGTKEVANRSNIFGLQNLRLKTHAIVIVVAITFTVEYELEMLPVDALYPTKPPPRCHPKGSSNIDDPLENTLVTVPALHPARAPTPSKLVEPVSLILTFVNPMLRIIEEDPVCKNKPAALLPL